MQLTEDLIRSVVQQVLNQVGDPASPETSGAVRRPSGRWGIYANADAAVAEAAFQACRQRPIADRTKAVEVIKSICIEQTEELDRPELEESKIGRLDHKISRLNITIPSTSGVEYLRTDSTSGDGGLTLTDYAPFDVIGAITPVTHSLPTLAGSAISMLTSGNTVAVDAHPSRAKIAAEGVRRSNRSIHQAIGLDDLLTIIDPPMLESANALFEHKGVKLLVLTGGPAVAGAALASKRRTIIAGPGNPPVVVDATACLENAARSTVCGAAFNNNLLCIGEKQVFAVADIFDKLTGAVGRFGGVRPQPAQIEALTRTAFSKGDDGKLHVNKGLIGQDPAVPARHAGVDMPCGTQILFGETGADHPFVEYEQMMLVIPFARTSNVDRAIELAKVSEHGFGLTAALHSRYTEVVQKMGKLMGCTIFVVNGPSTAGLGGEGVPAFSITGSTGEGVTTPRTFARQCRTTIIRSMRFV